MKLEFSRESFEKYSDVGFHSGALNLNYHDVEHEDCNVQGYDAVYYAKSVRRFERACCLQLHWAPSGFTALSRSIIQIYHACYTCSMYPKHDATEPSEMPVSFYNRTRGHL